MAFSLLAQNIDELRPGFSIRVGAFKAKNGIILGDSQNRKVAFFSITLDQVTTTSLEMFVTDFPIVSDTPVLFGLETMCGDFSTICYTKSCENTEEVARNAQYYVDNPEKWHPCRHRHWQMGVNRNSIFAYFCSLTVINEVDRQRLRPGDQIYTLIIRERGITSKHGIIVETRCEKRVVHFSEEISRVTITSIEEFADDKCIGLVAYDDFMSKAAGEVVTLAMLFAEDPEKWREDDYPNQSERFAEYCKKKITQPILYKEEHLKPGDHIFARDSNGLYRNHGIFLGGEDSQREVALFAKKYEFTSLNEFKQDLQLYWCTNTLLTLTVSNILTMPKDDSRDRVGYIIHKISESDLKPGDHIYAYRRKKKIFVYQHHGIYIGTNHAGVHIVIHFTGLTESKSLAKITRSSLKDFLDGKKLRLVGYGTPKAATKIKSFGTTQALESLPPQVVVATANYYAYNPEAWNGYHLISNNCEMFALYCKTGIRITGRSQIQGYKLGRLLYSKYPEI